MICTDAFAAVRRGRSGALPRPSPAGRGKGEVRSCRTGGRGPAGRWRPGAAAHPGGNGHQIAARRSVRRATTRARRPGAGAVWEIRA